VGCRRANNARTPRSHHGDLPSLFRGATLVAEATKQGSGRKSLPEPGPAFYLGAEDDKDEIHIRLAAIASHYQVSFKDLKDLHVLCLLGEDATLCAVGRTGKVETTPLYSRLKEAAIDIKPRNISIDTLSRAFAGNEIDRA
jgi:RecA-family ATPase